MKVLVAFLDLHDEIFIKKIKSKKIIKLNFLENFSKNIGKKNTISKLLKLLEKKNYLKIKNFKLKINKKFPS